MAHLVEISRNYNWFVRKMRSFLLDAPRIKKSSHEDLAILGHVYKDIANVDRNHSDAGYVAPETNCTRAVYRATNVVIGNASNYGTAVTPTVTFNVAGRTIVRATGSWVTDGFVAGNLIRIENSATAGNDGIWRILTITTTTNTNDTITLNTADTLAASDAADVITAWPLGGGAIFEMKRDPAGTNTHIGWFASNVEGFDKAGTVSYALDVGNLAWAIGDYWEFELERGSFSLQEDKLVTVGGDPTNQRVNFDNTAHTIIREDARLGGSWLADGFVAGGLIDITVNSGATLGQKLISTVTAGTITLDAAETVTTETDKIIQCLPRQRCTVDFTNPSTIKRSTGSWVTEGYKVNGLIEISNAVQTADNGYFKISTITTTTNPNDTITTVETTLVTQATDVITATPRNKVLEKWTDHRLRLGTPQGTIFARAWAIVPDADKNYNLEWWGIGPGVDPINNPQTVYIGFQTQFLSTTKQNIEVRCCDVVSDSLFAAMGNASPPSYIYSNLSPGSEMFLSASGEHVTGFMDVNTSVTQWFYQGFLNIHGSQGQHPRPLFSGSMGTQSTDTRATANSTRLSAFWNGGSQSSDTLIDSTPVSSSGWFRWVDGQWLAVFNKQRNGANTSDTLSAFQVTALSGSIHTWPWVPGVVGVVQANTAFCAGSVSGDFIGLWQRSSVVVTPTTRKYPLLPIVLWMSFPDENVIGEFKDVYWISGEAQASKNRETEGHRVYYVGQNHANTTIRDFAALNLN